MKDFKICFEEKDSMIPLLGNQIVFCKRDKD